jgi:hypothetical protein
MEAIREKAEDVSTKAWSGVKTVATGAWSAAEQGGRLLWTLGTSFIVLYLPIQHAVDQEQDVEMQLKVILTKRPFYQVLLLLSFMSLLPSSIHPIHQEGPVNISNELVVMTSDSQLYV